jgi:transcriptional regulator with XRE-family HTH domain
MHCVINIGATIKQRRAELGLSQTDLAKACDVNLRQIRRYENDEQQPALGVAMRLADALGITIGELAGEAVPGPRLTGTWWAAWQTYVDVNEKVTTQTVDLHQSGTNIQIKALQLSEEPHEGDYLWRGELRLWGADTLMGWYVATDDNVRSKGTMFFILHTQGGHAEGRWVGTSYDGPVVTGWCALARSREDLVKLIEIRTHFVERKETQ